MNASKIWSLVTEAYEDFSSRVRAAFDALVAHPNPSAASLARTYKRTHWGDEGKGETVKLSAADPRVPAVEMGELIAVIYRTTKAGDPKETDYHHKFSRPRPRLVFNDGGLIVAGGKYTITTRGIEG